MIKKIIKNFSGLKGNFVNTFVILTSITCIFSAQLTANLSENDKICLSNECYLIKKELGQGYFGKVFSVEDSYGNNYALKAYRDIDKSDLSPIMKMLADGEREFNVGQILNHPNIIHSVDYFSYTNNSHKKNSEFKNFLLLNFINGKTVYNLDRESLSSEEALKMGTQLVEALKYTYSQGYYHLDLHTNNVMIGANNDLTVIDLASFISYDELLSVYAKNLQEEMQVKGLNAISKNEAVNAQKKPALVVKVKGFLQKHPEVEKALKNDLKKKGLKLKKAAMVEAQKEVDAEGEIGVAAIVNSEIDPLEIAQAQFIFYRAYFSDISDICIELISNSNLSKEEKLHMMSKIKQIDWSFQEDVKDGNMKHINDYFDDFIEALTTSN